MADEGASPRELILEACRRNNTDLLHEVLSSHPPTTLATLLNSTRDTMGATALHIAARSGSYEVLDLLLDQDGLECDPLDLRTGNTPLHCAVEFANTHNVTSMRAARGTAVVQEQGEVLDGADNPGNAVVEILVDAGCDPRVRNKGKMKAGEVCDPRNEALRAFLRRAEVMMVEMEGQARGGGDVVDEEEEGGSGPESDNEI